MQTTALVRAACLGVACTLLPVSALAWGASGHHDVNLVAVETLPAGVPAFVRTPQATAVIEALGTEEDRLKGAGVSWDRDFDPAHYVDVGDDGAIAGVVQLDQLPQDMEHYDTALRGAGTDAFRMGYLPYSIADGWEQLRKDFAYWRAFQYLAQHAASDEDKASFAAERDLREALVIHDIGVWGHYVGDGSQPLHVTVHYNGWGKGPNPNGYTTDPIHAYFEGAFVRKYVTAKAVEALVPAAVPVLATHLLTQPEILAMAGAYLHATASTVPKLYDIEKAGGFRDGSPEAIAFTTARVADGAAELRNLVAAAWDNSAYASVGYPEVSVHDILEGTVIATPKTFGRRLNSLERVATALITPRRVAAKPTSVRWDSRATVDTALGPIAYWTRGSGPAVLLVHGWEGAHVDLDAFVEPLVAAGLGVYALDLPAHGESAGTTASIPDCGVAIAAVAARVGRLAGTIAHSAGCPATAQALLLGMQTACVVLVGTPERYERYVRWFAGEAGVDADELIAFLKERGIDVPSLVLSQWAAQFDLPATIVHSRDDDVCEIRGARAVAAAWPGSAFLEVDGLGHARILRDEGVIASIVSFIANASR